MLCERTVGREFALDSRRRPNFLVTVTSESRPVSSETGNNDNHGPLAACATATDSCALGYNLSLAQNVEAFSLAGFPPIPLAALLK